MLADCGDPRRVLWCVGPLRHLPKLAGSVRPQGRLMLVAGQACICGGGEIAAARDISRIG